MNPRITPLHISSHLSLQHLLFPALGPISEAEDLGKVCWKVVYDHSQIGGCRKHWVRASGALNFKVFKIVETHLESNLVIRAHPPQVLTRPGHPPAPGLLRLLFGRNSPRPANNNNNIIIHPSIHPSIMFSPSLFVEANLSPTLGPWGSPPGSWLWAHRGEYSVGMSPEAAPGNKNRNYGLTSSDFNSAHVSEFLNFYRLISRWNTWIFTSDNPFNGVVLFGKFQPDFPLVLRWNEKFLATCSIVRF